MCHTLAMKRNDTNDLQERKWKLGVRKIRCREGRWMKLTPDNVQYLDLILEAPPGNAVRLLWLNLSVTSPLCFTNLIRIVYSLQSKHN